MQNYQGEGFFSIQTVIKILRDRLNQSAWEVWPDDPNHNQIIIEAKRDLKELSGLLKEIMEKH